MDAGSIPAISTNIDVAPAMCFIWYMKKLLLLLIISAALITGCSKDVQLFVVNGPAMEPNFNDGDLLLVDTVFGTVQAGEVVVFEADDGARLIGRVEAVDGGDYIILADDAESSEIYTQFNPVEEGQLVGTVTLCDEGRLKCWKKTLK